MRMSVRSMVAFTLLGLAAVAAGGIADAGQPAPHADEPVPAPARTPHGFVQLIGEALSEVSVRPDQEAALEALGRQVEPLQSKVDDAENTLLLALADQVLVGHVDRDALEPQVAQYASARQEVSGELRSVFEQLHDLLDHGQREDFADALESRVHDVRRAILAGEQLDEIGQQLNLTEAQKQAIRDGLQQLAPALERERERIHGVIEAFRGETFSIEEQLPQSQVSERARARADRIIDLTAGLVSILDPAQREKLAARIHEAAAARGDEPTETAEDVGSAEDHLWVAGGVRRGRFGGVRAGVAVGGAPRYYYGRAVAYPYAVGWGYGW